VRLRLTSQLRNRAAWTLTLTLLSACAAAAPMSVEHFEQSHVEVRLHVDVRAGGSRTVVAEFLPTEEGVHLYGIELPQGGIEGAGMPTRLEVADEAWTAAGPVTASTAAVLVSYPGFVEPFPVYPDGPVTLELPVRPVSEDLGSIQVEVSFMACTSSGLCYLPVSYFAMNVHTR
jgi:hypothetical protein